MHFLLFLPSPFSMVKKIEFVINKNNYNLTLRDLVLNYTRLKSLCHACHLADLIAYTTIIGGLCIIQKCSVIQL